MKIVMLDANVVIDYIRHTNDALERLQPYNGYKLAVSFLVYTEVMAGAQPRHKAQTEKIFNYFPVMPYSTKAQLLARVLARKYHVSHPMDLLIASHAIDLDTPFLTNNMRDFTRYKELQVLHYKI